MDIINGYRDSHIVSSDDDSDDSDKECNVWKRATVKKDDKDEILPNNEMEEIKEVTQVTEQAQPTLKRKRNTIWSEVLQDQLISEDLEDCLLKNKPRNYGSRGKESYDYTLRFGVQNDERDSDSPMSDGTLNDEPDFKRRRHLSPVHRNSKKFVKLDSTELAAARKINKVLNEKKFYLIQRIVKIVGIEKAMTLLSMTEQVEEAGGMRIKNNTRRRTPGGVYIQLLKTDKDVTQEMLDKIFEGEMSPVELKHYYAEKKKIKKHFRKKFNKRKNYKETTDSKEMLATSSESTKPDETVPMDAEGDVSSDTIDPEKSSLENVPSMPVEKKSENVSDLEEGEIED